MHGEVRELTKTILEGTHANNLPHKTEDQVRSACSKIVGTNINHLAADVLCSSEREAVHRVHLKLIDSRLGVDLVLRHSAGNYLVEELATVCVSEINRFPRAHQRRTPRLMTCGCGEHTDEAQ